MRPGDGISPMDMDLYLNKQIATNLPEGHKISKSDFIL
jgi:sialic acid synthase SpsE